MQNVIVYANKISPSPWNGQTHSHIFFTNAWDGYAQSNIGLYLRTNGTAYTFDHSGVTTELGNWTTTPGTSYQVMSTVLSQSSANPGEGIVFTANSTGGAWQNIPPADSNPALAVLEKSGGMQPSNVFASATFQISIRKVGTTTPVVVSTITLTVSFDNLN